MKKLLAVLLAMAMVFALAACGTKEEPAAETAPAAEAEATVEPITISLAHCNPVGDPTDIEAEKFKEYVEANSNGAITVEIYPNAILGDWTELLEGLGNGVCDLMIEGFGDLERYTVYGALDAVPFMYEGYDHFMKVWHGEVGQDIMNAVCEDSGIKIFGGCYRGARIVTTTRPFTTAQELADLGLKIRVPSTEIYVKTWEALQTNPTPMNLNEVLTGLQQGTVEAQENPCIMSYNYGFYDVCKYIAKTEHVNSATVFMTKNDWFTTLPEEYQTIILDAAEQASSETCAVVKDLEAEYYEKWKAEGCEILEVDHQSFVDATANVVADNYPDLQEMVDKIVDANK